MANYNLTPNSPRPLSKVFVGTAPGNDARWRGVRTSNKIQIISRVRAHEQQQRMR